MITAEEIQVAEVRALSWKQPFASLMLHGKQETRVWGTSYRGLVLICASASEYKEEQLKAIASNQLRDIKNVSHFAQYEGQLINGRAIAVGRLTGCQKMDTYKDGINVIEQRTFVNYNPDLYVHLYSDVRAIKPFPWKGSQGWRTLTQEQKQLIHLL